MENPIEMQSADLDNAEPETDQRMMSQGVEESDFYAQKNDDPDHVEDAGQQVSDQPSVSTHSVVVEYGDEPDPFGFSQDFVENTRQSVVPENAVLVVCSLYFFSTQVMNLNNAFSIVMIVEHVEI